ncbi:MAG: DUF3082 domain-containing protein [Oscillatoriales cyanobacterium SM2_2_1]|nr:DUF3082 domain-containing protein [Oscillatoriales cyanobacterium SM2_2_1]
MTALNHFLGAAIASALATGMYFFTAMVTEKLGATPLPDGATLAAKLTALVRAALLAVSAGATMIFGIIALGLFLLALQQTGLALWQRGSGGNRGAIG